MGRKSAHPTSLCPSLFKSVLLRVIREICGYFSVFFSVLSVAKKSVLISSLDCARDKVNLCLTDPKTAIPVKLKNLCYLVLSTVKWIHGYISLCSRWPLWLISFIFSILTVPLFKGRVSGFTLKNLFKTSHFLFIFVKNHSFLVIFRHFLVIFCSFSSVI
jgi:hypothetical protein